MVVSLYLRSVGILWTISCLFQICLANCAEGSCFQVRSGWNSWYIWMGIAFTLLCCCGTIASWCRHIKSKQRLESDTHVAGLTTVHVTSASGSMLDVMDFCSVPVDTTKSPTQPEAAARTVDTTVPAVAATKQQNEQEKTDGGLPPAYCDVYPPPPLYFEATPLPTYQQARDTSNPAVPRL